MRLLLFGVVTIIVQLTCIVTAEKRFKLLRISPISNTVLEFLDDYNSRHTNRKGVVDVWYQSRANSTAHILVASHHFARLFGALHALHVTTITVLPSNTLLRQMELEKQRRRRRRNAKKLSRNQTPSFNLFDYNSYEEIGLQMANYMNYLSKKFPQFVRLLNITRTFQGRELVGVKIARRSSNNSSIAKPIIYIDGGLHAREWIAPAAALYLIDRLVSVTTITSVTVPKNGQRLWNARYHRILQNLLDKFNFIVVPMANPDGYVYSMTKDRFWRKTRSRVNLTKQCIGADANRNWGYHWGENDENHSCSIVFGGMHPFSEPETAGLRNFVGRQARQIAVYISLHAYGQMLLAPWGWTDDKPQNHKNLHDAAVRAIFAIQNATGAVYTYDRASGTSLDYMHHAGVPYVYAMELRPSETDDYGDRGVYGFLAPVETIEPSGIELIAALSGITDHINIIKKNKSVDDRR